MKGKVQNCVQAYRKKNNLTQEDLARQVEVSRQTIIAIEKGNYTPSVYLALCISRALKRPVEEIFSCEEEQE